MAKIELHGTVEEQAGQLYDLAEQAMEEGRYTAAYRYYQEIERAVPGFRNVSERLAAAQYAKREQRFLLWGSLIGAMLLVILARVLGAENELVFLGAGAAGLVLGFAASHLLFPRIVRGG